MPTLEYVKAEPPRKHPVRHTVVFIGQFEDEILGVDVMAWRDIVNHATYVVTPDSKVYQVHNRERNYVGYKGRLS